MHHFPEHSFFDTRHLFKCWPSRFGALTFMALAGLIASGLLV